MIMQLTGWAIIHSLWEGGLIALVVAAALAATRRSTPQMRYAISLTALALMVIAPLATAVKSMHIDDAAGSTFINDISADISLPQSSPEPKTTTTIQPSPIVAPVSGVATQASPSIKERLDPAIPWVVLLWMIGLSLASIRLIGGYARTKAIRNSGDSTRASAISLRVRELADRLGISQMVTAIESATVDVPLVVGAIRPIVVVPASLITGLTPIQLDMLLAHELAHIRRHDYLVNLFQTVVETLLFYHPAVRWVSERAREERENCCDDVAIALCGVNPSEYTSTLLVLEESRGQRIGFATAATGGSLLRRAVRLLTGQTPRVELGPLWFAGLLTISAALFTGREAFASISSAYVPISSFAAIDSTKKHDKSNDPERNPDASRAAPSEVVKAPPGTLDERWRWAERSRSGTFWIGYLIGGNASGAKYYTSDIPIRLNGNNWISGRMQMDKPDLSGMIFYGAPLRTLFGDHASGSTAIFFKSVPGLTGRHIERIRLASYGLPVYFDKLPVVWLDSATDAESIPKIRSLLAQSPEETRRDLVSALGSHRDQTLTTPILIGLLESHDQEGVRREAADWLGHNSDSRAMTALSRAARSDNPTGVRRASIDAIGSFESPAGTDTLIAFIQTLDQENLRRSAVDALGDRSDTRVKPFLTSLIHSDADSRIRESALESIVDRSSDTEAAALVIDIAKHDVDSRMRRNAVEMIPKTTTPAQSLSVLRELVYGSDDESVRRQAVETIGDLATPASARLLKEIIDSNLDERVQMQAVESIANTLKESSDASMLAQIARTHPSDRVRRQALESIAQVASSKVAIDLLLSIARTDPSESVRKTALEQLAEGDDPIGMNAIASIVRGKDELSLRMRALDVYAESASAANAIALIKSVLASDDNIDLRIRAVNRLEDVKDDAGVPVLRQVAQSNLDQRLRDKAARILRDR